MKPPERIIIEPVRGCNLQCSFCPVRFTGKQMMRMRTAEELTNQLTNWRISLHLIISGRGEPTLHPNLLELLETFRNIPDAHISLETNGIKKIDMISTTFLTDMVIMNTYFPERIENRRQKYKHIPGVVIQDGYPMNIHNHWEPNPSLREQCVLPSTEMIIHWNGNVSLCRYDWRGEAIVGNIHKLNVSSIWTHSERLNWSRRFLANRIRCPFPWCSKCDHRGKRVSDSNYDKLSQGDVEAMRRAWDLGGNDGRTDTMGEPTGDRLRRTQSAEMSRIS